MNYLVLICSYLLIFLTGMLSGYFLRRKRKSKLKVNDIYDHRYNEELYYSIRRLNKSTNEYLKQVELNNE